MQREAIYLLLATNCILAGAFAMAADCCHEEAQRKAMVRLSHVLHLLLGLTYMVAGLALPYSHG